jgi:hypothetical protein
MKKNSDPIVSEKDVSCASCCVAFLGIMLFFGALIYLVITKPALGLVAIFLTFAAIVIDTYMVKHDDSKNHSG